MKARVRRRPLVMDGWVRGTGWNPAGMAKAHAVFEALQEHDIPALRRLRAKWWDQFQGRWRSDWPAWIWGKEEP